jgi:hypothetical protein
MTTTEEIVRAIERADDLLRRIVVGQIPVPGDVLEEARSIRKHYPSLVTLCLTHDLQTEAERMWNNRQGRRPPTP